MTPHRRLRIVSSAQSVETSAESIDTTAAMEQISEWAKSLSAKGFADKIVPSHWGDDWRERRHMVLTSDSRCSILELTVGATYVRVVADPRATVGKPFAYYRYDSTMYPERPKTEFYTDEKSVSCLSAPQVAAKLAEFLS